MWCVTVKASVLVLATPVGEGGGFRGRGATRGDGIVVTSMLVLVVVVEMMVAEMVFAVEVECAGECVGRGD
jgi:hypothetical protein